jgi:hypothetical protein
MGPVRIYMVAAAALLLVLAAVGAFHLVAPRSAPTSVQSAKAPASKPVSRPSDAPSVAHDPVLAITEIGSSETRGRNGEPNVAVKIGVTPRPNTKKGEVEIRVSFFDVNPAGEMRPTDAQVDYQWLTPVRDWTVPTPKYLVATYLGLGTSRKSAENLHYGGFLVRVYFDGQLQAEQSEPKQLAVALRNTSTPPVSPAPTVRSRADAAAAPSSQPFTLQRQVAENSATPNRVTPSPTPIQANRTDSSGVPYASPVPNKPGFVYSPDNPKFLIDVRGFPPGTEVTDPNTGKPFKVP